MKDEDPDNNFLAPSKEEQIVLVLQGKCPHNKGWVDMGHGHNSNMYECRLCREAKWW